MPWWRLKSHRGGGGKEGGIRQWSGEMQDMLTKGGTVWRVERERGRGGGGGGGKEGEEGREGLVMGEEGSESAALVIPHTPFHVLQHMYMFP